MSTGKLDSNFSGALTEDVSPQLIKAHRSVVVDTTKAVTGGHKLAIKTVS